MSASHAPTARTCNLCIGPALGPPIAGPREVEQASVPSNVRQFKDRRFPVWRCPRCRSIHGAAQVDLAQYYKDYPFHRQKLDWMATLFYDNQLRRLRRAGLRRNHRLLDYGCGGGTFVRYLRKNGYVGAVGYDAYSAEFADSKALDAPYHCVISQDVIEHVAQPLDLLRDLGALCLPGGVVAIGTPNAEAIDLTRADDFRHTLHQPYHLHILSKTALLRAGADQGWHLLRYYPKQYSNTLWPFLNQAFALYYARLFDDTVDLMFDERGQRSGWLTPRAVWLGFFGYFLSLETDVMAVFRTPLQ